MENYREVRKIVFLPFNLLSHVGRCLMLAESIRREFHISFAVTDEYKPLVSKHGFDLIAYDDQAQHILTKIRSFDFSWINAKNILSAVRGIISVLERSKPDVLISDSNVFSSIACELFGIPHVSLLNTYMLAWYEGRYTDPSYLNLRLRIVLRVLFRLISDEKERNFSPRVKRCSVRDFTNRSLR